MCCSYLFMLVFVVTLTDPCCVHATVSFSTEHMRCKQKSKYWISVGAQARRADALARKLSAAEAGAQEAQAKAEAAAMEARGTAVASSGNPAQTPEQRQAELMAWFESQVRGRSLHQVQAGGAA